MATTANAVPANTDAPVYDYDIVRMFSVAAMFWGIVGFTVGLIIALQLAFPELNFGEYLTFGRLRPVHTSGVIFAFGGNMLLGTSYFIVQRTCHARLWGGWLLSGGWSPSPLRSSAAGSTTSLDSTPPSWPT